MDNSQLFQADDPGIRMDGLCRFIEFWLGPRKPEYGEPYSNIEKRRLPMPLRCLYEFAGRWPHHGTQIVEGFVAAFSHQDSLCSLEGIKQAVGDRIIFLFENQAVWDCRTLALGNDPPVWCQDDPWDENGDPEQLVSESLSRFLVTFILQELTFSSRLCLTDDGLTQVFEAQKQVVAPIWPDAPYVQPGRSFFLWNNIVVMKFGRSIWFGANSDEGIDFLSRHQGPIHEISLGWSMAWTMDIRADGSARLRYLKMPIDESVEAPAKTFDFAAELQRLTQAASDHGHYDKNPVVHFQRRGQSCSHAKHIHDWDLARGILDTCLRFALKPNRKLEQLFQAEWR